MKIAFSKYTPRTNGQRSLEEAISEVQREMEVRKRIYDKWLDGGRDSWVDLHDRMERLLSALTHLLAYSKLLDAQHTPAEHEECQEPPIDDNISVDFPASKAA